MLKTTADLCESIARDKAPPRSFGSSEDLSVRVKFGPTYVNKAVAVREQINAQPPSCVLDNTESPDAFRQSRGGAGLCSRV